MVQQEIVLGHKVSEMEIEVHKDKANLISNLHVSSSMK